MSQLIQFEPNIVLINYPKQATFGHALPKNKVHEHSGASTRLEDLLIGQVKLIVWRYKLAPEMISLPARLGVPRLRIFSIQFRTSEPNSGVLHCIDGAVQPPIIFELSSDGRTKVIATYKRPNESDASRWVLSDYFVAAWLSSDNERVAVPLALNLGGSYEQALRRLIPTPACPQESLADLVTCAEIVTAKQREVEKAANRFVKERQFNHKAEINAQLRQLRNKLEELTGRENA